jgi:hypothetical protein
MTAWVFRHPFGRSGGKSPDAAADHVHGVSQVGQRRDVFTYWTMSVINNEDIVLRAIRQATGIVPHFSKCFLDLLAGGDVVAYRSLDSSP